MKKQLKIIACLIVFFANPFLIFGQSKIYWTEKSPDRLIRANTDGSNKETILENYLGSPIDLIVEESIGKIFWVSQWGTVHESNLDGSDIKLLFQDEDDRPARMTLDEAKENFYWMHGNIQALLKIPLNGEKMDTIPISSPPGFSPVIDSKEGKVYYVDNLKHNIYRMDINGQDPELIFEGLKDISDLALDQDQKKLYLAQIEDELILVADLETYNVDTLHTGYQSYSIQLDLEKQQIYFTGNNPIIDQQDIYRSNLDGSEVEVLFSKEDYAIGFDIDFQTQKLYLAFLHSNTISRVDLNDKTETTFLQNSFGDITGFEVNQQNQQLFLLVYNDDRNAHEVWVCDLQGEIHFKLLIGQDFIDKLYLDEQREHLYWITHTSLDIYRYDMKNMEVEYVLTYPTNGNFFGNKVEIDFNNEMVYWIETEAPPYSEDIAPLHYIKRTDFDVSRVDTIITDTFLFDLKLDLKNERLYWANRAPFNNGSISSSDLNGQAISILLEDLYFPNSIDLDLENEKIFWAEGLNFNPDITISRSNFDGTDKELILSNTNFYDYSIFGESTDNIIELAENNNHLKLYPNPASEKIYLELTNENEAIMNKHYTYDIFDYSGRILNSGQITNLNLGIDISPFPSGIYFLCIYSGNYKQSTLFFVGR